MKPRFTILLELRRAAEDAAKQALGRLETARAAIVAERDALRNSLESADAPPLPALRMQLAAWASATRSAVAEAERRIAEADAAIADARGELLRTHREVRAVEAIRERDAQAAGRLAARREGRANDAFAAARHREAVA
jgi:flagellar export protein FliJ